MGASQRRKGRAWEQDVARRLREAGYECRRGVQGAGEIEPDIVILGPNEGRVGAVWPWIECGHGADMDGRVKWQQAHDAAVEPAQRTRRLYTPIAVTKRDRQPATVTVTVAGLVALVDDSDKVGPLVISLPLEDFLNAIRRG